MLCSTLHAMILRANKYDGEKEYWYDSFTRGTRGTRDIEGLRDSTRGTGTANGMEDSSKSSKPHLEWDLKDLGECPKEDGTDKVHILYILQV